MTKINLGQTLTILANIGVIAACGTSDDIPQPPQSSYASAAEQGGFCKRLPRAAYADFRKRESSDDWFEVYEVANDVWAIYEPFQWQEVISYLIVGEESAAAL